MEAHHYESDEAMMTTAEKVKTMTLITTAERVKTTAEDWNAEGTLTTEDKLYMKVEIKWVLEMAFGVSASERVMDVMAYIVNLFIPSS
jgi:hypothetical protein